MNHTNITNIPLGEVVTAGKFLVDQHPAVVLFDLGASHSFMSPAFASKFKQKTYTIEGEGYCIRTANGDIPTKLVAWCNASRYPLWLWNLFPHRSGR